MLSDLALLELQIEALFTHDEQGHIVRTNEPNGRPAPRFFLGKTPEGNRWRVRYDVPPEIARLVTALAEREPVTADLAAMPQSLSEMCALLANSAPIEFGHCGPAYRFPEALPHPIGVTRITRENWRLLQNFPGWSADLADGFDAGEPRYVVVEQGMAVSICASSRLTPRAAEAGLETLGAFRGRGYAQQVVLAWARSVRASGRVPLYSTSWDNVASRAVAHRLGLAMYGADLSIP